MHTHAHSQKERERERGTRPHEHSDYAKLNLHSLKRAATEMDENSDTEQKTWHVHSSGKKETFLGYI